MEGLIIELCLFRLEPNQSEPQVKEEPEEEPVMDPERGKPGIESLLIKVSLMEAGPRP